MASQGLLYDLSKLDAFDFENDPKWSKESIEYYTINGAIYGARPSDNEPGDYLLWNKRLFQEAGLDPDLPYKLQAEGKWDWEHFEELCQKLTKDIDNDGITDIYGFGGNDGTIMNMGIYSNGAKFVDRDETGKLIDGTVFDSSVERGEPATFAVGQVIPGWVEGLQLMREGAAYRLFIPSNLAYGSHGTGPIQPNSTLIFGVQLLKVEKK